MKLQFIKLSSYLHLKYLDTYVYVYVTWVYIFQKAQAGGGKVKDQNEES